MINKFSSYLQILQLKWPVAAMLFVVLSAGLPPAQADVPTGRVSLRQEQLAPHFLRQDGLQYRNYALRLYNNYPNHTFPYVETPKSYYNDMGNYLVRGFDVWQWSERRGTGEKYASTLLTDQGIFEVGFDNVVVGKDSFGDWGYSLIVGDGLIARLSPLVLSKTDFNGARLDVLTPWLQGTLVGSRIEKPIKQINPIAVDETSFIDPPRVAYHADASVMMLGGRLQSQLGGLTLGLNGANVHIFDSTADDGNSLRGIVHPRQLLIDYLLIRFQDDSPSDGQGGPIVEEVRVIIDGEVRNDLKAFPVVNRTGVETQVGTTSLRTGAFRAIIYNKPSGARGGGFQAAKEPFYYNRGKIPLYADYIYRLQHEAGIDVSKITNVEGLLSVFQARNADERQQVSGTDELVYVIDLSREQDMHEVQIEALVSNDYRIDEAMVRRFQPKAADLTKEYTSSFWRTAARAKGNVQDGSNLKWVRFAIGEDTGLSTYSADLHLTLAGLEVTGEYARSALYSRFAARTEDKTAYNDAPANRRNGSAYFLNAVRWFGKTRVGGEYFSMNPDFQTSMRSYQPLSFLCCYQGVYGGMINETLFWDLLQDNEDGDNYPDRNPGEILGSPMARYGDDRTGVLIGQDEDNDGISDTDKNANLVADHTEPFLIFNALPNTYVYGLDRNNNDEPDHREDDLDFDMPYDHDLRGFHLFGSRDLSQNLSLSLGRYDVEQIAGGGRNRSTYALLTYVHKNLRGDNRLFFENHLRKVEDNIVDEYMAPREKAVIANTQTGNRVNFSTGSRINQIRPDLLWYRDSYVNESYLDVRFTPLSRLKLSQQLRLRFNWQQQGEITPGIFQRGRRLDHSTVVSRAEYSFNWGRVEFTPQFKFMMRRLTDREFKQDLISEYRTIPILRARLPILKRTSLAIGIQGMGPFPYRLKNDANSQLSTKQWTSFASLTNRSDYFGYELYTILGLRKDRLKYDDKLQKQREYDDISLFVNTMIGFTQFGRLL